MAKRRTTQAEIDKDFWTRVNKHGPIMPNMKTRCWVWTASVRQGYGVFRGVRAHRVSWEMHDGPVPKDLHVLHKCDNPSCIRYSHLWLGTDGDNAIDKAEKGRARGNAKLDEDKVRTIRKLREGDPRKWSITRLAKKFEVSPENIWHVITGRTWKYVK